MLRVVTRNSVYTVALDGNGFRVSRTVYTVALDGSGFRVSRTADMWGRRVLNNHLHWSPSIAISIGAPFETSVLSTTPVLAVVPYAAVR